MCSNSKPAAIKRGEIQQPGVAAACLSDGAAILIIYDDDGPDDVGALLFYGFH